MKKYYMAYGSNLNYYQMRRRCPLARFVGKTILEGYELVFKISKTGAYLTIQPSEKGKVPVAIWQLTESDEESLDCCEGYPIYYGKQEFAIQYKGTITGRKHKVKVFTYLLPSDRPFGMPSERYFTTCLIGYDHHGFDHRLLYEARNRSLRYLRDEPRTCPYCGNIID